MMLLVQRTCGHTNSVWTETTGIRRSDSVDGQDSVQANVVVAAEKSGEGTCFEAHPRKDRRRDESNHEQKNEECDQRHRSCRMFVVRRVVAAEVRMMRNRSGEVMERHLRGKQHSTGENSEQEECVLQACAAHGRGTITETERGVLQRQEPGPTG